jgi:L-methionine (R)-S-oxide reductase
MDDQGTSRADLSARLERIAAAFGADSGTIHLLGADGLLHLEAHTAGMPEPVLDIIRRIPVGKGMAGLAVERCEPVESCNIQTDETGDVRPGARATQMAGAIVVPILMGEAARGALGIANRNERNFSAEEIARLLDEARRLLLPG